MLPTLARTLHALSTGATTSRALVESCLDRILDPAGEGARTFTRVNAAHARTAAEAADRHRHQGHPTGPLHGLPLSLKDLFDIAGEPTPAASRILADAPPAPADSPVAARLRAAGAILLGRTNMTEFAYSGLGLNPHHGTPRNPFDRPSGPLLDAAGNTRGRIPGGSSSGAAIAVTDRMCLASIGSDTGGSVRIPAALCGLAGFKPTARRVPLAGTVPLSPSLDAIGPLAPTVSCCARLDAVLAADPLSSPQPPIPLNRLRLGLLQGYVLDDLDPHVSRAWDRALRTLTDAGATLTPVTLPDLDRIPFTNQFASTEAFAWHRPLLDRAPHLYDPHVRTRILHGAHTLAADYLDLLRIRREIITAATLTFAPFDAILFPTVPHIAPLIAPLETSDDAYFHANGAMLRNPSLINYLDGCAVTLPLHDLTDSTEPPTALTLAAPTLHDTHLLHLARTIEATLHPLRQP